MSEGTASILSPNSIPEKMKLLSLLSLLVLLLSLTGCQPSPQGQGQPTRQVASKGLPSELLVVMDKAVCDSPLADTLEQITAGPVPGLPQVEPYFRTTRLQAQHFAATFSTFHSQLWVSIDPSLAAPLLGITHDATAKPQIVVTAKAASVDQLASLLSKSQHYIRDVIADFQLHMRIATLRRKHSRHVVEGLHAALGMHMLAPEELGASKRAERFFWAGSNKNEKDLNIVAYTYPWNGTDVLQPLHFAAVRDSVMQLHIPGAQPHQWMETARQDSLPLIHCRLRQLQGKVVQEVRGLWQMRHGAQGGPFVALARIDTARRQVVVAEGFVYSPSTAKRDLLRRVEAAIHTLAPAPRAK